MKQPQRNVYKFKLLERSTLRQIKVGSRASWSKLALKDLLAEEYPRIPKKNIIVWDPSKQPEPLV